MPGSFPAPDGPRRNLHEFAETFFTDAIFQQRVVNVTSPTGNCVRRQTGIERWFLEPGGTYTVQVISTGGGTPCYTNDPPTIAVSLGTNFGSTVFLIDRVPNTNQYRGTVTIPTNACGSTF